jgi:uncharacterized membrane protein YkoI
MTVAHALLVGCGLALSAVAANAQSSGNKVSKAAAEKTALKWVGGGTLKSQTTGSEAGVPIYTFDINVANKAVVEKVNVDADNGKVIGCTYAGPQK